MFVVIFGRSKCSYCENAKKLAKKIKSNKNDFDFKYIDIVKENISKEDLTKKIGKLINTVPQIFVDNKHIGGYTEFASYVKKFIDL